MASVNSVVFQRFLPIGKPIKELKPRCSFSVKGLSVRLCKASPNVIKSTNSSFLKGKGRDWVVGSVVEDVDFIPVQSSDSTDQQDGVIEGMEREREGESANQVGGFADEGRLSFEGAGGSSSSSTISSEEKDIDRLIDRAINTTIVLAVGTFAITKLLTIDRDYWHVYDRNRQTESDGGSQLNPAERAVLGGHLVGG